MQLLHKRSLVELDLLRRHFALRDRADVARFDFASLQGTLRRLPRTGRRTAFDRQWLGHVHPKQLLGHLA